jgi:glycosyltransferase involved in cell wall biosynthesis
MGRFVARALDSIGDQTHLDWETILIDDDGPEDGTCKAVADFARRYPTHRVKYIRNAQNVGCGQSRNIGIESAQGEFLAFLDPDDIWGPRYLERALCGIQNADLCFCQCRSIDEEGGDLGPHTGGRTSGLVADFPRSLFRENFLVPSCTFVRRSVIEQIGLFHSDRSVMYAADWDFYLRCVAGGASFAFLESEDCYYRRHAGAATSNYLAITAECTKILRENWQNAGGQMKIDLGTTLHIHLCRLAYLRISFRDWRGLRNGLGALWLEPLNARPVLEVIKGLKNNWTSLQ